MKTARAVVFKDGYCLLVKTATGKTVGGSARAYIEDIPKTMVLGTFWVTPKKGKVVSMVASQQIIPKQGKSETERKLLLEFDPKVAEADVALDLCYLGPGLRWIPTYRVALGKEGTAELTMQAEILNEVEDLADVPVDLVVGVPNFRFREVVSPMSLERALADPLRAAAPQIMGHTASNVMFSQRSAEFRGREREGAEGVAVAAPALPPELAGEGAQDLFIYHVPKLSVRAGERAAIPIISAKVPFRHLYTWNVHLAHTGTEALPDVGKRSSPVRLLKNDVWHQIELTNATEVPWTTGAALVMQGYLPLGQELLTYTSSGAKCQLPVTVAIDVRGTYAEEETDRKPNAVQYDGHSYVQVTKKGTLRVSNRKREAIDLLVTCELGGNAIEASDDGKIAVTDFDNKDWTNFRGHPALTGHSTIHWELSLEPGKTKELTCTYRYFVR